jgi:D-psicose/D-tagatose/L-ribulose 3-epimerase
MIPLGINTMVWTGSFGAANLRLLDTIRESGFEVAELGIFDFPSLECSAVRSALKQNGLACTATSALPEGLSLLDSDPEVRRRTVEWICRAGDIVAQVGASVLAGPFYAPVGYLPGRRRTEDEWSYALEGLRQVGEAIAGTGVRLAIEPLNRFETYFLNTAADALRLCREVGHPSVGILFDTFHANVEEKNIPAALHSLGPALFHVHLSENDRGIPGTGHIPFRAVFDTLRSMNYDSAAVVESFATTIPEIARAAAIWRDLYPSSDEFSADSMAFLRGLRTPSPTA